MNVLNARLFAKSSLRKPGAKTPSNAQARVRAGGPVLPVLSPRLTTGLHLVILFLLLLSLRWNLFDLPLERDESAYAYLGKRALEGLAPYRDFYEMKPPLLFYSYALIVKIFGYSLSAMRMASFTLNFIVILGLYDLTAVLLNKKAGFCAGILYAVLSVNPSVSAIVTDAELVQMAAVLPGLALMVRYFQRKEAPDFYTNTGFTARHLVPAGALLSAAVLIKQSAVFFVLFALLALPVAWYYRNGRSLKNLLMEVLWLAAGASIPILLCVNILSAYGVWAEFWLWNAIIPGEYVSAIGNKQAFELFRRIFKILTASYEPIWLLGALGCAALFLKNTAAVWVRWLLAIFFACSFASIFPGKRFYGHYWLQFIPAVAVLGAYALFALEAWLTPKNIGTRFHPALAYALAGLIAVITLSRNSAVWKYPNVDTLIDYMYGGNNFSDAKRLAGFLKKSMKPKDQLMVLGSEPEFYIYLNKKAPTRHFYVAFLTNPSKRVSQWQEEAFQDIQNARPEYVVFTNLSYSWSIQAGDSPDLYDASFRWARQNYTPLYWIEYENGKRPAVVSGAEAAQYRPADAHEFYVVMRRKDY